MNYSRVAMLKVHRCSRGVKSISPSSTKSLRALTSNAVSVLKMGRKLSNTLCPKAGFNNLRCTFQRGPVQPQNELIAFKFDIPSTTFGTFYTE